MLRSMLISAVLLGLFAIIGTGVVAYTADVTAERIAENERLAMLQALHQLVEPERYDNDILEDRITVRDPDRLGTTAAVPVYRARLGDQPVAIVMAPTAPDGYGGPIRLLVAINYDGSVAGVRVIRHQETPGLGDKIELERSDWIRTFENRSLTNPPPANWAVKRDGGVFDQFTGATITPRSIVRAVENTLHYYREHRDALFDRMTETEENHG